MFSDADSRNRSGSLLHRSGPTNLKAAALIALFGTRRYNSSSCRVTTLRLLAMLGYFCNAIINIIIIILVLPPVTCQSSDRAPPQCLAQPVAMPLAVFNAMLINDANHHYHVVPSHRAARPSNFAVSSLFGLSPKCRQFVITWPRSHVAAPHIQFLHFCSPGVAPQMFHCRGGGLSRAHTRLAVRHVRHSIM